MGFFLWILLWLVPAIISVTQGYQKERVLVGWLCGIFLGWLGAIIMLILEPYQG